MSTPATYTFLPWVRQGIAAAEMPADPGTESLAGGGDFNISVQLANVEAPVARSARFYGPADILGIDTKQIVRVDPAPYARAVEPNYLAVIEFDRPDFPWLFTPASANSSDQLRPWLVLIVVKQQPGVELTSEGDRTVINIHSPANPAVELIDLRRSWAWAHAQISGDVSSVDALEQVIRENPERASSRLICPRRLEVDATFHACLVPAFAVGVKAALEEEIEAGELTTLAPAWNIDAVAHGQVRLPVFHHWQFSTGPEGDFELLVKKIHARPIPETVGSRTLDTSSPGEDLPSAAAGSQEALLPLAGALVPLNFTQQPWTGTFASQFQTALRKLIDPPPTPNDDPVLGPPRYADVHAKQSSVPPDGQAPHWFRELNLDPRNRVAASLGVAVVQSEQEALMAEAWRQAGEIERANALLRHAQLAQLAADSIYRRHLAKMDKGALIELTRPTHTRVFSPEVNEVQENTVTVGAAVGQTNVQPAATVGSFRRATRPRGPVYRRIPLVQRNARGIVRKIATNNVSQPSTPPSHPAAFNTTAATIAQHVDVSTTDIATTNVNFTAFDPPTLATVTAIEQAWRAANGTRPSDAPTVDWTGMFSLSIAQVPPRPQFRIRKPEIFEPSKDIGPLVGVIHFVDGLIPTANAQNEDSEIAKRFRAAVSAHQRLLAMRLRFMIALSPQLKLDQFGEKLLAEINPRANMAVAVRDLVNVSTNAADDELEPISMSLEFRRPMYEPLSKLSPDLFLPGIAGIPADTALLLETNKVFVEAYMAGLNHEMGRELLWRNYPAQPGVTCFRDFLDSRSRMPPSNTRDIPPINEWNADKPLGGNSGGAKSEVVLVIKGELMQRYPTAIVSAVKAKWANDEHNQPRPSLTAEEQFPIFHGHLEPDIAYFGFHLTEPEALGDEANHENDPGWFFVIQQRPGEPRFGVDADVAASAEVAAGANAGATALALIRRPLRTAIHASSLLRPRTNA